MCDEFAVSHRSVIIGQLYEQWGGLEPPALQRCNGAGWELCTPLDRRSCIMPVAQGAREMGGARGT